MRRKRHRDTKVWHDPLLTEAGRRKQRATASRAERDSRPGRGPRNHRSGQRGAVESTRRGAARIIAGPAQEADPREAERVRLLERLLSVEGRPAVTHAAQAYAEAGFELPATQAVWLQMLEHRDEQTVRAAIEMLAAILAEEAPERRAVLEPRLRRIEQFADESATRQAAAELRRMLNSTHAARNGEPAPSSR